MLATLTVRDETLYGLEDVQSFTLDFPDKQITAQELIETRIRAEVEKYNSARPEIFRMLIQPIFAERFLNGFKAKERKQIDWREQFKQAVQAFESNGFILLIDDLQVEELNQIIEIEPQTSVTFLKLVSLVGG